MILNNCYIKDENIVFSHYTESSNEAEFHIKSDDINIRLYVIPCTKEAYLIEIEKLNKAMEFQW